jgi:hypothetical protein
VLDSGFRRDSISTSLTYTWQRIVAVDFDSDTLP